MLETRHCPQCGSTRIMSVPDSSQYLCYDCKYEFAVWEKWYQDKFAEIVSAVESDESRLPDYRKLPLALPAGDECDIVEPDPLIK